MTNVAASFSSLVIWALFRHSCFVIRHFPQNSVQIVAGAGQVGILPQAGAKLRLRFRPLFARPENQAEIVMRLRLGIVVRLHAVGFNGQRPLIMNHGLRLIALPRQRFGQIILRQNIVARHSHGMAEERHAVAPVLQLHFRARQQKPQRARHHRAEDQSRSRPAGPAPGTAQAAMMKTPINGT